MRNFMKMMKIQGKRKRKVDLFVHNFLISLIVLQIVYTENDMSHRFIRFTVEEKDHDSFKLKLDEYIKDMYSMETGLQFHKLQDDTVLVEEVNGFGKMISPTQKKNTKSHTLLFVCDLKRNTPSPSNSPSKLSSNLRLSSTLIGEMYLLKENDILRDEYQKSLGNWILSFIERFSGTVNTMKFFELRPQIYG